MNLTGPPTEKQVAKLRANWQSISRRGLLAFVFLRGTLLLLWICLCVVGFTYLKGTQRVLRQTIFLEGALPAAIILSYLFPLAQYWTIRSMIRSLDQSVA